MISITNNPICSLILCTLNRTVEVDAVLKSLSDQTFSQFECVVVDQNEDNRLDKIIDKYKGDIAIVHVKSSKKGLSKNRNIGMSYVKGNIVGFPDDDCEYPKDTIETVVSFFEKNRDVSIFCCAMKDKKSGERHSKMPNVKVELNKRNFFNKAISIGIFVKVQSLSDLRFDEQLGVGAPFGAAEESDFVSSLLEKNYKGFYDGTYCVYHPLFENRLNVEKYRTYNLGFGAFAKKEFLLRKKYYVLLPFMFDLAKRLVASCLPMPKRRLYRISFISKLKGFLNYKI